MKKADLEQIRGIVREEIQPVRDIALADHQTLNGTKENPELGLVKQFSAFKADTSKHVLKMTGVVGTIGTMLGAAIDWLIRGHN